MITTNSPLDIHVFEKALQDLKPREGNRWTLRFNYSLWKAKCFSCLYSYNSADGDCNRKLELTQMMYKYQTQTIFCISQA